MIDGANAEAPAEGDSRGEKRQRNWNSRGGGRGGRSNNRGGNGRKFQKKWKGREQFKRKDKGARKDVWDQDLNPGKYKGKRFDSRSQLPADHDGQQRDGFEEFVLKNENFEEYYKAQMIVTEEEWSTFMFTLQKQLPATFRINGSGKFAKTIREKLQQEISTKLENDSELSSKVKESTKGGVEVEDEDFEPLKPLAWYPNQNGWQIQYSRNQIRKLPVLKEFHEFLKRESEAGNITRQETASMIPPFFLDVSDSSKVLDMCAAPGSKTFQLLEMLHSSQAKSSAIPAGYVVANDADSKRCNLLTHQTKRMTSPCLLVTNHMGQKFPVLRSREDASREVMLFDRILCDVPCSGDGTLRKAPDLWRRWNVGMGLGLHRLQLKIALKACELLQVGGKMVYSTCSLNPVENEAVVAEILRQTDGSFELLDVSQDLPDLKRRPGMKTWLVKDRFGWIKDFSEVDCSKAQQEEGEGEEDKTEEGKVRDEVAKKKIVRSMFPDAKSDAMPLERSCRILPHDANTGGFFVAVFKKLGPYQDKGFKARKQEAEAAAAAQDKQEKKDTSGNGLPQDPFNQNASAAAAEGTLQGAPEKMEISEPQEKKKTPRWKGIDPVVPVDDEEIKRSLRDFYGIEEKDFDIGKAFVTRTPRGSMPKRIYYVSDSIRKILDEDRDQDIRITSVGVKIFEKQTAKHVNTKYRITQEGLPAVLPLMTKQIFR